jgi:S-adenosylmethionine:tRNA ribosyltransferase-isomerase
MSALEVVHTEALAFELPAGLEAHDPPEADGRARDDVRLMVASPETGVRHRALRNLPGELEPGDLLVVNTSATLPAALRATRTNGQPVMLHLSGVLPGGMRLVELRRPAPGGGTQPFREAEVGERLALAEGSAELVAPYPDAAAAGGSRLWLAALRLPLPLLPFLARHGAPIRYAPTRQPWSISAYQTIFASEPGSSEMPSAARPFSGRLLAALAAKGVGVAPIVLHCGVSSLEDHEPPYPERFRVPESTARQVNEVRASGGRVIALGTTVVRALETAAERRSCLLSDSTLCPADGYTELVVQPGTEPRVVDGLITGWHEPRASHLLMLEAIAGRPLLEASYRAALAARYRWHEFGDLHLLWRR